MAVATGTPDASGQRLLDCTPVRPPFLTPATALDDRSRFVLYDPPSRDRDPNALLDDTTGAYFVSGRDAILPMLASHEPLPPIVPLTAFYMPEGARAFQIRIGISFPSRKTVVVVSGTDDQMTDILYTRCANSLRCVRR